MILVTTGSSGPFESLIQAIDEAVFKKEIEEHVICQIGNGDYVPKHCEHFKFKESIDSLIDEANLVITHGGTGTVTDLIRRQKRFIAVANTLLADNHQVEFLTKIASICNITWTDNLHEIAGLIKDTRKLEPPILQTPSLIDDLRTYLKS
jgi:beta-1,4-N-acetylglucosaminyltransferase